MRLAQRLSTASIVTFAAMFFTLAIWGRWASLIPAAVCASLAMASEVVRCRAEKRDHAAYLLRLEGNEQRRAERMRVIAGGGR